MSANTLSMPEMEVDQAWCSELCKKRVSTAVIEKYPCKQKFARIDVFPLYAEDPRRYYRVILWVNDWSTGTFGPAKEIWRTVYVTLEGSERRVVSIEENQKRKLPLTTNGMKFMEETGIIGTNRE